jgi:hypothetical protein
MSTTATYTKLKSGDWGIRVQGIVRAGDKVTVRKKSGESKVETVEKVLWAGDGVSLCMIRRAGLIYDDDKFNGYGARRGGWRKACVTGGNCSSFGSGRSCGGFDCDGF